MKLNKDDQIKDRKTKRVRRDMVLHPGPRRRIKTLKPSATLSSPRARSPQTVSVPAQSPRLLRRKTTTGKGCRINKQLWGQTVERRVGRGASLFFKLSEEIASFRFWRDYRWGQAIHSQAPKFKCPYLVADLIRQCNRSLFVWESFVLTILLYMWVPTHPGESWVSGGKTRYYFSCVWSLFLWQNNFCSIDSILWNVILLSWQHWNCNILCLYYWY